MTDADDTLLRKPIVIIGAPRSGTSMLMNVFLQHPQLALLREPRLTWRHGNDGKSDMLLPEDARPDVRRHIRGCFADMVREQGKQRMVEKTPSNALRMGFVDRVFPDCRFLHTIRHGEDAILSIRENWMHESRGVRSVVLKRRLRELKLRQMPYYAREFIRRLLPRTASSPNLWGPRLPGIESLRREMQVLDICCLQWRMCVEFACHYGRKLPPERYMEFHIEQLSPQLLDSILEFCELDHCPQLKEYFRSQFDPDKPGRRKADAAATDLDVIRQWIEPTLQWLGYC